MIWLRLAKVSVIMPPTRWLSMSASVSSLMRSQPPRSLASSASAWSMYSGSVITISPCSNVRPNSSAAPALRARLGLAAGWWSCSGAPAARRGPLYPAHRRRRRTSRATLPDTTARRPAGSAARRRPQPPPAAPPAPAAPASHRHDATMSTSHPARPAPLRTTATASCMSKTCAWPTLAREHGTPLFVYSKAVHAGGAGRLPARLCRAATRRSATR